MNDLLSAGHIVEHRPGKLNTVKHPFVYGVCDGSPPRLWGSRSDFRIQMISTLPPKACLFLKPRTPGEAKSTDTRVTAPWADGRTDASLQNGFRKSGFQKIYLRAKGGHVFTPSALPGRSSTLTENLSDPHRNEGGATPKNRLFWRFATFLSHLISGGSLRLGFFR